MLAIIMIVIAVVVVVLLTLLCIAKRNKGKTESDKLPSGCNTLDTGFIQCSAVD